jgi:arsenite methyltransferase
METSEQIKDMVRQKYSEIALQDKQDNQSSCCGSGCCSTEVYNIMTDDYSTLEGYNPTPTSASAVASPPNSQRSKKAMS